MLFTFPKNIVKENIFVLSEIFLRPLKGLWNFSHRAKDCYSTACSKLVEPVQGKDRCSSNIVNQTSDTIFHADSICEILFLKDDNKLLSILELSSGGHFLNNLRWVNAVEFGVLPLKRVSSWASIYVTFISKKIVFDPEPHFVSIYNS